MISLMCSRSPDQTMQLATSVIAYAEQEHLVKHSFSQLFVVFSTCELSDGLNASLYCCGDFGVKPFKHSHGGTLLMLHVPCVPHGS